MSGLDYQKKCIVIKGKCARAALSSFPSLSLSLFLSPADLVNRGLARCGQMGGRERMDGVVSIGTTATNHHRSRGSASDDLLCHASVLSHTPRTTSPRQGR